MNSEDEGFGSVGDLSRDLSTGVRVDTAYRTPEPDPRDVKVKDLESQLKVVQGSRDWHVDRVKYLEDSATRARENYESGLTTMREEMRKGRWSQARLFVALTELVWFVVSVTLLVGTPYAVVVWKFDSNYWWFMVAGVLSLIVFYLNQNHHLKKNP